MLSYNGELITIVAYNGAFRMLYDKIMLSYKFLEANTNWFAIV